MTSQRIRAFRDEYPRQFWVISFGLLINSVGNGLVSPFYSLYFTQRLGLSMTDVGVLFSAYGVVAMLAQLGGGVLVDRLGRKPTMVVSLLGSAVASLALGLAGVSGARVTVTVTYLTATIILAALTGSLFGPALSAMVADLVGSEKRSQVYGLTRVVQGLGVSIGPAIGGLIAAQSYLALFVIAGFSTLTYALLVLLFTRETRPQGTAQAARQAGEGFSRVLRDRTFLVFCALFALAIVVWSQARTTLPVYLNRSFGVTEQWYGLLMSVNATMMVVLQFPVTRITDRYARTTMLALGVTLFAIGFGLYGVVAALPLFFVALVIWTLGELVAMPVAQAFVADLAPATLRGRYIGVFSLMFTGTVGVGPLIGGSIMDNLGGPYIWAFGAMLGLVSAVGLLALRRRASQPAMAAK